MSQRLHYLDALRSFAILYGILVHAATIGAGPQWISEVSAFFRMGAFFLVSGFFAAMVLERAGQRSFLQRRLVAILVPLACGLLLLNPVTNYLIHCWHNGFVPIGQYLLTASAQRSMGDLPGPAIWHLHLWFLMSLAVYVLLTPAARAAGRRTAAVQGFLAHLPAALLVLVLGLAAGIGSLGLRLTYEVLLSGILGGTRAEWPIRITLHYLPYFVLGVLFFGNRGLFERFHKISPPALLAGVLAVIAANRLPQGDIREAASILSGAMLTVAAIAALLAVFRRFFGAETILSRAASSVYSIYILHFLLIYLTAFAWRAIGLEGTPLFLAVATSTFAAAVALHRLVIAPSPLLGLMFNGKLPASGLPFRRPDTIG